MPKHLEKKLSDRAVKNAKPGKQWLNDGGGVYLRVRESGEKSFYFRYRHPRTNKLNWIQIGRYPDCTLADARGKAAYYRKIMESGASPQEHESDRLRAVETERRTQEEEDRKTSMAITVLGLFDEWFQNRILPTFKRPEWIKDDVLASALTHTFKPDGKTALSFADLYAKDVTNTHIVNIIESTQKRGALTLANDQLRYLERMFAYGMSKGYVDVTPYARIEKREHRYREQSRERALSMAELRTVLRTVEGMRANWQTQGVIQMALYTGQRTGYVCEMEWSEIHDNEWHIPPEKQGKESRRNIAPQTHVAYLPDQALKLLERLRAISGKKRYVFASDRAKREDKPIAQSTVEQAIGRHLTGMPGQGFRSDKKQAEDIKPYWDMPHWNAHDLRRTAATRMAEDVGIAPHIIEKIINHAPSNELASIYIQAKYTRERQEAAALWGGYLAGLVADNVLTMTGRRNA